jgi:hypothetical protein
MPLSSRDTPSHVCPVLPPSGDNAIKTKALEDRIRKQEEMVKRDSNELQVPQRDKATR